MIEIKGTGSALDALQMEVAERSLLYNTKVSGPIPSLYHYQ